jgi:ABC-type nitrate/sulfonate/bicarbonate transport system permease component
MLAAAVGGLGLLKSITISLGRGLYYGASLLTSFSRALPVFAVAALALIFFNIHNFHL